MRESVEDTSSRGTEFAKVEFSLRGFGVIFIVAVLVVRVIKVVRFAEWLDHMSVSHTYAHTGGPTDLMSNFVVGITTQPSEDGRNTAAEMTRVASRAHVVHSR